jgi:hypothetical protein
MYHGTSDTLQYTRQKHWGKRYEEQYFLCRYCHAPVSTHSIISGVQNRNHCPYCLWSRHVDHFRAGDRLSACKAIMQPIGLTIKRSQDKYGKTRLGELMVVHQCKECGKLSINRIAADDLVERLTEIFYASIRLERSLKDQLCANAIHLLEEDEWRLVVTRLHGISQN